MVERVDPWEEGHPIKLSMDELNEGRACTVVALANVTGYTFEESHKIMKYGGGREDGKGMFREEQLEAFKTLYLTFKIVASPYTKSNRITINQFLKKHPEGKFYCACRGHAFAIIDGVLYDHSEKLRRQITFAHRFYNAQDLEEIRDDRTKTT